MLLKILFLTLLLPKNWLLKQTKNNVPNKTKIDPAYQNEPTTYCYISPDFFIVQMDVLRSKWMFYGVILFHRELL